MTVTVGWGWGWNEIDNVACTHSAPCTSNDRCCWCCCHGDARCHFYVTDTEPHPRWTRSTAPMADTIYDTIRYEMVYLRALTSWRKGQLSLAHGTNKNSSGDEIANVNFLRRPTSFNKLYDSYIQVLRIKSWIFESATVHLAVIEYLYGGRRAVPLQTFTTRHSNRKLSIVLALSTTCTQCARKLPNSVK